MLLVMIIVALNVTIKAIIIILQRSLSLYPRVHLRPSLFATGEHVTVSFTTSILVS